MAAGTLASPGTEYGPCEDLCDHLDCRATRIQARTDCRICLAAEQDHGQRRWADAPGRLFTG